MVHGVDPELFEETVACHNLNKGPEDNDCGHSEANVSAPSANVELFPEHKDGANQAGDGHGPGDGVIVAQEYGVVAEHEQEIE